MWESPFFTNRKGGSSLRKLTLAALSYTISVFVMHYFKTEFTAHIMIFSAIAAVIAAFVLRGKFRTGAFIIALFVLFGAVRYEAHYHQTVSKFDSLIGEECRITGEICEYPVEYEDSVKYTIRLDTDLLPKVKAVVYDYTASESNLRPGTRFRATVRFNSALHSLGEETDTYVSKGIYVRGYVTDEVRVISENSRLRYLPVYLAESIRETIAAYMPRGAAGFLSALLTGDKALLYEDAELSYTLSEAGLSHVVAVSGMHVSFVVALAMLLFGQSRGWLVSVIFIILFAVMTGMTPSVMRAVFMQTLFLFAPVLRREADGVTSISFALLILLVLNPFAVSSVGLQLSFLAMAGIILVTPRAVDWFEIKCPITNGKLLKGYRFITASLSASLGATIFTAPLCAYYFGSISVLAPLTNLLVLWIVPICFGGGFLLCATAKIIPVLAPMLAALLDACVSFVFLIAEWVSSLSVATVYLPQNLMLLWFVIVYASIGIMFLFKSKGAYRPVIPMITAILGLVLLSSIAQSGYNSGMTLSAIDVGQGQCIAVLDGDKTMVADCGGDYDSGETVARWLYSHGRKQVDLLVISHFDEDHVNGIQDLMLRIPVKEIVYSGTAISEDELAVYQNIRAASEKYNAKLRIVNTEADMELGAMHLRFAAIHGDSNGDLITYLQSGSQSLLIMGDADFAAEKQLIRLPWLKEADYLVVGHHGSAYSTGEALLEHINPKCAIISCGYNSYGHPSEKVLDRLAKKNVVIYRTDQMGTIEIKVR